MEEGGRKGCAPTGIFFDGDVYDLPETQTRDKSGSSPIGQARDGMRSIGCMGHMGTYGTAWDVQLTCTAWEWDGGTFGSAPSPSSELMQGRADRSERGRAKKVVSL